MKLDEVVVQMEYYNITKFYQILMKNKKVLYITHLTASLTDSQSIKEGLYCLLFELMFVKVPQLN